VPHMDVASQGKPPLPPWPSTIPTLPTPAHRGPHTGRVRDGRGRHQVVSEIRDPVAERAVLMFADATGDAVIFDSNQIIRKHGRFLVQTNFRQSQAKPGERPCERYKIATAMLDAAATGSTWTCSATILAATHQEGGGPTQYSNIYDLKRRVITSTTSITTQRGSHRPGGELAKGSTGHHPVTVSAHLCL